MNRGQTLLEGIQYVYAHREEYIRAMSESTQSDGIAAVMALIREAAGTKA